MPQFIVSQRVTFINRENPQTPPNINNIGNHISNDIAMKTITKCSAETEQHNTTHKAAVPTV